MNALALATLACTWLASASPPQEPVPAAGGAAVEASKVTGVVRAAGEPAGQALSFALVEVADSAGPRAVLAGPDGRYVLEDLTPGLRRIRASHVGYESIQVEVLVPTRGTVTVDLDLRVRPIRLPPLLVEADLLAVPEAAGRLRAEAERARTLVDLRTLELSPGMVEAGVGATRREEGDGDPPEAGTVLYMRGSTADMKLVLLDGAPVYTPFHLGGLIPSFDPAVLGQATHHVGGAPARWDGGLSYILDLRTRVPRRDALHASGAADILSVQGAVEAPLTSGAGVLAAGRALHDLGSRLAGGDASPYGYADGLARVDLDAGSSGHVAFTAFANRESVRLDLAGTDGSPGLEAALWGNAALSALFSGRAGALDVDVGGSLSRYEAELPVRPEAVLGSQDQPLDPTAPPVVASGQTERARLTFDALRRTDGGSLRFGASFDGIRVRYGARGLQADEFVQTEAISEGSVLGAYVDAAHPLAPELKLRWGFRADYFDPGGARGALRMAVLWTLSDNAILTVAAGRYHQLARRADTEAQLDLGNSPEVGAAPGPGGLTLPLLAVAQSDHLVVSLDQELSPYVRMSLEGFLKSFHGVDGVDDGELASSGIDLRVLRQGENFTAWLGYSLAWYWETVTAGGRSDFTGRHLLSTGLQGRVLGPLGLDARVSFSDGLPLTAVNLQSDAAVQPTSESMNDASGVTRAPTPSLEDGFLRVDAEVYAEWTRDWGHRPVHIRPYVKVLNALDHRDAMFYYFQPWRDEGLRPLAELALVPVVGFEWRF